MFVVDNSILRFLFFLTAQERQRCSLLTDSILLREMAEELRRGRRQQGVQPEAGSIAGTGGGGGALQTQEDKERFSFQDVLK